MRGKEFGFVFGQNVSKLGDYPMLTKTCGFRVDPQFGQIFLF